MNHTNISNIFAFDVPYLSQDNRICTHVLLWEMILTFDKCSTFFTTTNTTIRGVIWHNLIITTHQTTNMTEPPMWMTYYMNTRVVGSKTMVVIVTPPPGRKHATCLLPTNQYSNKVGNLGMIRVLVLSALRVSYDVLCRCSVL